MTHRVPTRQHDTSGKARPTQPDAHRAPRFNEVLILKVALAALTLGGLVTLVCFFLFLPSVKVRLYEGNSETERELRTTLTELRGAWDPRERQRILDGAPAQRSRLNGTLNRMLRLPDFDLLAQAVDYAGAMGEPQLRPALAELVAAGRPGKLRGRALIAAERLRPWNEEELAVFLTKGPTQIKLAALEVISRRQEAPWGEVIDLMSSDDEVVRAAAVAAVPRNAPPSLLTELWVMAAQPDPETYQIGLRALAQVECTPEIQARLVELLPQLEAPAKMLCLDMIGSCANRLQDPGKVWALAVDETADPVLRARALYCLEQTQSFEPARVLERYPFMVPLTKHFAARCLLSRGHTDAARLLLDLVEDGDAATELASRRLLSWMTGQGPGTEREEFEKALADASGAPGELPAPIYEFARPGQ